MFRFGRSNWSRGGEEKKEEEEEAGTRWKRLQTANRSLLTRVLRASLIRTPRQAGWHRSSSRLALLLPFPLTFCAKIRFSVPRGLEGWRLRFREEMGREKRERECVWEFQSLWRSANWMEVSSTFPLNQKMDLVSFFCALQISTPTNHFWQTLLLWSCQLSKNPCV